MGITDPVTHALIGASISVLSGHSIQGNDPVFLGCVIGAVIPDIDIIAHYKGRLNYLLKHRGASHSLLAIGGMALGISTVLFVLKPQTAWLTIFIWTFVAALSHSVSDLLNAYGTELFWPFSRKKFTVNMIMLADPAILLLFLSGITVGIMKPDLAFPSTLAALCLSILYVSLKEWSRRQTKRLIARVYKVNRHDIRVIPAMYKPFSWNFLILHPHHVRFGVVRNQQPVVKKTLPMWSHSDPRVALAMEGTVADIFRKFTPYYHVIPHYGRYGATIRFVDLRYWVKDDFLYQGQVFLDRNGKIAREVFSWKAQNGSVVAGY